MPKGRYLFSSEVVFPGHPDKVADQISDGVLDAHLRGDPKARVACETVVAPQFVAIVGEVTSRATVDAERIARDTIRSIGYTDPALGFDAQHAEVIVRLVPQSPDIARGVDADTSESQDQGAGDQGMMFGYATTETPELMPAPLMFSRRLASRHAEARRGEIPWLRPDGKCQVTVEYDGNKPLRIDTVVFSAQTAPRPIGEIREQLEQKIVRKALPGDLMDKKTRILVNPTGIFEKGGPAADSGLTGRKIIVDTYGGAAPHGGGAFSGKDPSKVDRSAAYAARWVAKNVVAAGFAERCTVQVAYAIGVAQPVSILVDTAGTGTVDEDKLRRAVASVFDLRPRAIIERLDLLRPVYQQTAREGHFGRTGEGYTWERTDRVEELKRAVAGGAKSASAKKPAAKPKSARAKAGARATK